MATPNIPPSLGQKVVTRTINWQQLVQDAWGEDWAKWEVVYRFSSGETRLSTDYTKNGIYNGGAH